MRGKGRKQVTAQKRQGQPLWTPSLWWVSPAGWAGMCRLWVLSPVRGQCLQRGCCPVRGSCPSPGGGAPQATLQEPQAKLSGQPWQKSPRPGDGDAAPSAARGHPTVTLISPANSWTWSVPSAHTAQARGPDKPLAGSPRETALLVSFAQLREGWEEVHHRLSRAGSSTRLSGPSARTCTCTHLHAHSATHTPCSCVHTAHPHSRITRGSWHPSQWPNNPQPLEIPPQSWPWLDPRFSSAPDQSPAAPPPQPSPSLEGRPCGPQTSACSEAPARLGASTALTARTSRSGPCVKIGEEGVQLIRAEKGIPAEPTLQGACAGAGHGDPVTLGAPSPASSPAPLRPPWGLGPGGPVTTLTRRVS